MSFNVTPAPSGPARPAAAAPDPASLAWMAQALGMADTAVWHLDLATRQVTCNRYMFRLLGLPEDRQQLHLDDVLAMQHPDDRPHADAFQRELMKSRQTMEVQLRYVLPDGRCRHMLSRRAVLRDEQDRPVAVLGVTQDVSERVERERQAATTARRFELVARAAGVVWWIAEPGVASPTWSEDVRQLLMLQPGQALPTPRECIEQLIVEEDRAAVRRSLGRWLHGGAPALEMEFRLRRTDGRVLELLSQSRAEPSPQGTLRFGIFVDVTERRSVARALRDERERTTLAAQAAGMGIWEWNAADGSSRWTDAMWHLRGLKPRSEVLSEHERNALLHADDRERVRRRMRETTERGEPLDIEFRVVWPDGQVRWIASRSVPLPAGEGGARRRIGVNWDVTDQRLAAQARRDAEFALRESQAKSRFLARMSHELRTPLNAVLGFTQLLLADAQTHGRGDATPTRWLEHVQDAGQHLLSLINDVLDLARLEGGELRLERQSVDLAELTRQTLPLVAPQALARQVQLHAGALDFAVLGDRMRLRQVLLNLLSNAVKYNREGGSVRVDAEAAGAMVRLRVHDSGRGIAAARLADLFQPFNRLGAEHEAIEGTGIGLAIVKSLVEHMGGHVTARSEPGRGSTFEVQLPRASAAAPAPAPARSAADEGQATAAPPPAASAALRNAVPHRVLYVEDNPVNALIVQEMLAPHPGYALTVAASGRAGLQAVREWQPHLVLLDMQLPDMDGFAVLRELRAQPATARLPVVALSANALPEAMSRGLAAGLTAYWTKPLDMTQFMQRLQRLLPPEGAAA